MEIYKNHIIIRNIYYMLSYAYNDLQADCIKDVQSENFENLTHLMAEIIILGVSNQIKKGLLKNYENETDEIALVKGKLNIAETISKASLVRGKAVCTFDFYTENTLLNRIIKSTILLLLSKSDDLKEGQPERLKKLLYYFSRVDEISLILVRWDTLIYNRNNSDYRLIINICRMIVENMLQTTENGDVRLVAFSDKNLNKLFEKFILEYYRKHYDLKSNNPEIKWATLDDKEMLPKMRSDVVLTMDCRRLIIDAKFYSHTTQSYYDSDSFHSHNLYQIFTYVKNESNFFKGQVFGLLLYAKTTDDKIPQAGKKYVIDGNLFSVKSLDLSVDFEGICRQLDEIAEEYFCLNLTDKK